MSVEKSNFVLRILVGLGVISDQQRQRLSEMLADSGNVILISIIFLFTPGFVTHIGCLLVGIGYPMYASVVAATAKIERSVKWWLLYWVVYICSPWLHNTASVMWLGPLWYHIRLPALCGCSCPSTAVPRDYLCTCVPRLAEPSPHRGDRLIGEATHTGGAADGAGERFRRSQQCRQQWRCRDPAGVWIPEHPPCLRFRLLPQSQAQHQIRAQGLTALRRPPTQAWRPSKCLAALGRPALGVGGGELAKCHSSWCKMCTGVRCTVYSVRKYGNSVVAARSSCRLHHFEREMLMVRPAPAAIANILLLSSSPAAPQVPAHLHVFIVGAQDLPLDIAKLLVKALRLM